MTAAVRRIAVPLRISGGGADEPAAPDCVRAARRALCAAAAALIPGVPAEVELCFTDGPGIRALNASRRGRDAETDVLSFPALDLAPGQDPRAVAGPGDRFGGRLFLGSVVICVPKALEQAEAFGHPPRREFAFLAAHSMLHLLGWDHERSPEEEAEQFALQEKILRSCGLVRPSADGTGKES